MKPRLMEFLWASIFCALLGAYVYDGEPPAEGDAICTTDSDCQRFCPPPADDPDCDGGPQ